MHRVFFHAPQAVPFMKLLLQQEGGAAAAERRWGADHGDGASCWALSKESPGRCGDAVST